MALAVTILVGVLALNLLLAPVTLRLGRDAGILARLALTSIAAGSLYAINSWDFPTFLLVVVAGLAVNAYLTDLTRAWWRAPLATIPAVAIAAVVAFSPFYLQFEAPANGIGRVTTPSNLGDVLQIFGLFLGVAVILLLSYSLLFQPAEDAGDRAAIPERETSILEAGSSRLDTYLLLGSIAAVTLILGLRFGIWTLLLLLLMAGACIALLYRVLNSEEPNKTDGMTLILILVACLSVAFP